MEKEKFISKLNIKDYNNQLEKILSKKTFSEDTKNLLLSMLYKIENAYEDYSLVSGQIKTKQETLEQIIEIIANECNNIEIIKTKESKVIPEEGKIITYANVRKMLYEIYQIDNKKMKITSEYEIIKPALEETLNQGYSIVSNEVIRDFDGWSWNIAKQEIENLIANLLYQTLKILVGQQFLEEWKKCNEQDYIAKLREKLEKKYDIELEESIFKVINQIAILNIISYNEQEKERLIRIQDGLQKEFNKLDDKKAYLTELGQKKKKCVQEIKKIDSILNNDRMLKNEFINTNQNLDMNKRIFSLSDFAEILEKDREDLMKKINEYSKKMEPLNFIKIKTQVENKLVLLKEIELQNISENIYISKIQELLKLVCKAIKVQIDKIEEKEQLVKLVYKIRYYSLIYVEKQKQVKDIIDLNNLQKSVITKACKQNAMTIFSRNIKENYEIIKNILQEDIIELEKIYFRFIQQDNKTLLEIYDEENIYKTIEYDNIQELNVKLNKKIKVFV